METEFDGTSELVPHDPSQREQRVTSLNPAHGCLFCGRDASPNEPVGKGDMGELIDNPETTCQRLDVTDATPVAAAGIPTTQRRSPHL